jgi:hypothetical protein
MPSEPADDGEDGEHDQQEEQDARCRKECLRSTGEAARGSVPGIC